MRKKGRTEVKRDEKDEKDEADEEDSPLTKTEGGRCGVPPSQQQ